MSTRFRSSLAALSALAAVLAGCTVPPPDEGDRALTSVPAAEPAPVATAAPARSPDEALQALPDPSPVRTSRSGPTTRVVVTAKDGRFDTLGTLIARVKEDGAVPKMRAAFSFEADVTAQMRRELEAMAQAKVEPAPPDPRKGFVEATAPAAAPEAPEADKIVGAGAPEHGEN
jgi:hypothetical protein